MSFSKVKQLNRKVPKRFYDSRNITWNCQLEINKLNKNFVPFYQQFLKQYGFIWTKQLQKTRGNTTSTTFAYSWKENSFCWKMPCRKAEELALYSAALSGWAWTENKQLQRKTLLNVNGWILLEFNRFLFFHHIYICYFTIYI